MTDPFDDWWAHYPKPVKKIPARDAFRWAMQNHNADGTLPERMINTVIWQKASGLYSAPKYWPDPDKWILTQRWTDEPLTAAPLVPTTQELADFRMVQYAVASAGIQVNMADWLKKRRSA
jgi:hypothetical protein